MRKEISTQLSTQTRTYMSDNLQIQATFHAPSQTPKQLMVSRFLNCLGFRNFLRNIFLFCPLWSYLLTFHCCQDLNNFLAIFFCLLTQFCFFFFSRCLQCVVVIVVVAFAPFILYVFNIISPEMFVNLSLKFDWVFLCPLELDRSSS